jgi:hypothetical protein
MKEVYLSRGICEDRNLKNGAVKCRQASGQWGSGAAGQ